MRPWLPAPVLMLALAAACSSQDEAGAPPVTAGEQRALAEARSMIPADEVPPATAPATPAATESARP